MTDFDHLLALHLPRVHRAARSLTPNEQEAEQLYGTAVRLEQIGG
jgi:DNA-directed RNA polymerase specialized sigma24 family protein